MHIQIFNIVLILIIYVSVGFTKINVDELKCLVCKASLAEMEQKVAEIDPSKTMQVGDGRLDAQGNYKHKTVSQAKSELYLSELIDSLCERMDDYIRATWKSNGTLTLIRLIENGQMNPLMGEVDAIQDEDLNKSVKYYCETIVEEHEDEIIKHLISDNKNAVDQICSGISVCPASKSSDSDQHGEL